MAIKSLPSPEQNSNLKPRNTDDLCSTSTSYIIHIGHVKCALEIKIIQGLPTVLPIGCPGAWHASQQTWGPLDYSNAPYLLMKSWRARLPLCGLVMHTPASTQSGRRSAATPDGACEARRRAALHPPRSESSLLDTHEISEAPLTALTTPPGWFYLFI